SGDWSSDVCSSELDVAIGRSVDRVAKGHIVGRHCLSDGAGGTANGEKAARHFLTSPDFGECPVLFRIQIDLKRFSVCPDVHLRLHTNSVAAILYDRKYCSCCRLWG